uniref:Phytosulfokine n=1 Tax=Leersia perrieri TaxID=77586 RepID=A0A0D9XP35_9ORYZ
MRPSHGVSSSLRASALALLLLLVLCFVFHSAAAARPVPLARQEDGGAKAAAADHGLLLKEDLTDNGDEVTELMGALEDEEEACKEEGGKLKDECVQRRLLRDAHLDYIYTQHKNKP